ncbi:S8 family peptidase [Streptomyces eurythermus]|uniref:S8 family peptidase n=1 Tax=Streptomyces eurythermus TaxID=42237 RepID=UPI0033E6347C
MARKHRLIAGGISAAVAAAAIGTVAALPANATPTETEGKVIGANSADAIKGSYIVTMKKSAVNVKTDQAEGKSVIADHGGKVRKTFTEVLNGYSAAMSEGEARELAADPAVDKVFANEKGRLTGEQDNPPSWGLDRIDTPELKLDQKYKYPDKAGEGVTVYVVDTGVEATHPDFGGRAKSGTDVVDGDDDATDGHGHGTHIASTIAGEKYGVAKKADIVGVRVFDNGGHGTAENVIAGLDWVVKNASGPSVVNLSSIFNAHEALDTAVRNTIAKGITFTVAAGNFWMDAGKWSPQRVTEALTVGATNKTDAQAGYSNYGKVLDLYAPGSGIVGAGLHGGEATMSGTSMAAPHVAGVAALYLAGHPDAKPDAVAKALTDGASKGVVGNPGPGSPNLLLNVVE